MSYFMGELVKNSSISAIGARRLVSIDASVGHQSIDIPRYAQLVDLAHCTSGEHGDANSAEALAYYAWVARAGGHPDEAAAWLKRSAANNPAGVETPFAVAYDQLNTGRLPQSAAIAELRHSERPHYTYIGNRIDALDGFMAQANSDDHSR